MGTFTLRGARHKIFDVHKQRTNSGVKEDPNRRALSKQYNDSCIFLDSHSYFHNNQLIPRIPQIMPKMVVSAFIVLKSRVLVFEKVSYQPKFEPRACDVII